MDVESTSSVFSADSVLLLEEVNVAATSDSFPLAGDAAFALEEDDKLARRVLRRRGVS